MTNTGNENNGEIDLFGDGNTGNYDTDSDSICRTNGIMRTNMQFPSPVMNKPIIKNERYKAEIFGLIGIVSLRVTQLVTFMSGN